MVRSFCATGNNERVKCAVHAGAGILVGVCAAYNITASCFRRDRHLRINAVIYSLAVLWELKQTMHHLKAVSRASDCSAELKPAA